MLFTSFISWWYGAGWKLQALKVERGIEKLIDQFSIPGLLATLFAPFRQISAGAARANAPLDAKFHLWLDRTFSRFMGAFIRLCTIFAGVVALFFAAIVGFLRVVGWPLLPLLPIIGLLLSVTGWVPWN